MKRGHVVFLAFVFALTLVVLFISSLLPNIVTNHRLESAAIMAKSIEVEDGHVFNNILDWWGEPIKISCGPTDDGMAFFYTAVSTGKDKTIGTIDDLKKTQIDLNKSKMLGHYVGKKAKEFVKGFKDGEKEKSKFDGK